MARLFSSRVSTLTVACIATYAAAGTVAFLCCTALVAAAAGQTKEVLAQQDGAAPLATDRMLTMPAASLSPEQITQMQQRLLDWPQLARYRDDNASLLPPGPGRVVFFGDSITDAWGKDGNPPFFPGKPYINRGIGGQTTPQMLIRFQQDVVALKPAAVLILAGTNDIAGNTGLSTLGMTEENLRSMVAVAKANGIRVILASVLPTSDYPWRRGLHPQQKVRDLNVWMESYAAQTGSVYLDYYTALTDKDGGMKTGTSKDGVHPTAAGYAIMGPLAQAAIDRALTH